jgi:hypothetical protein
VVKWYCVIIWHSKVHHIINQQELKLCAYLIMNLSSKEITQLTAISARGVEISRYRLRKKLLIPTEIHLFEFLFDIQREIMK